MFLSITIIKIIWDQKDMSEKYLPMVIVSSISIMIYQGIANSNLGIVS